jgi:S-adenosylmethionine hydrolase
MKTTPIIHLITDYGTGDPAFTEVMQKLLSLSQEYRIIPTSVPAFSTLATGFWTHQFALVNPLKNMIIYTNTAPRKDKKEIREKNEGERLVYATLKNGVRIIGVNAGYCFSFVKPYIESLFAVNVANKGSQFRSRDFYPEAVIGIAENNQTFIGEKMNIDSIPDAPGNRIAWIDGYGNLKTTMRKSAVNLKAGEPVFITIGDMKRTAYFTDGTFSVREGELAFAPGSSGGSDPFMEIFLRGLSAWREFGKPHVETEFKETQ